MLEFCKVALVNRQADMLAKEDTWVGMVKNIVEGMVVDMEDMEDMEDMGGRGDMEAYKLEDMGDKEDMEDMEDMEACKLEGIVVGK